MRNRIKRAADNLRAMAERLDAMEQYKNRPDFAAAVLSCESQRLQEIRSTLQDEGESLVGRQVETGLYGRTKKGKT
jgi:hypothetical protein